MKFAEKVLIILCAIGIGLRALHVDGGSLFVFSSLLLLAVLYLLFGFALYNNIRLRDIFSKTVYTDLSAGPIVMAFISGAVHFFCLSGILFTVCNWPAHTLMLFAGGIVNLIFSLVVFFLSRHLPSLTRSAIFIRSAVLLAGCLLLLAVPSLHFEAPPATPHQQQIGM